MWSVAGTMRREAIGVIVLLPRVLLPRTLLPPPRDTLLHLPPLPLDTVDTPLCDIKTCIRTTSLRLSPWHIHQIEGVALRLCKFHQVHPFPSIPSDVMRKVIWKVEKILTNA